MRPCGKNAPYCQSYQPRLDSCASRYRRSGKSGKDNVGGVWRVVSNPVAASEDRVAADSIYRLQQEGWVITQKADRVESRAGLPPYQHLVRGVWLSRPIGLDVVTGPLPARLFTTVSAIANKKSAAPSYRAKRIERRPARAIVISIIKIDSGMWTSFRGGLA
ncbi:MAG: hypothetical protein CM1200mP41_34180 [Gammaproteobacteria bacterium]|nr:MAG: hypothetical protein CM1200mP41_34180 [Gammaproteobacteria bacterium]